MSIAELGAVGEFLGSIAVLITLVVLVFQIRQTRRAIAANSYTTASESIFDTLLESSASEFLSNAFVKARDGTPLEPGEEFALGQYYRSLIRRWELVHYQTTNGYMPKERLTQFGLRMGNLRSDIFRKAWEADESTMTDDFKEWATPFLAWNQGDT